MDKIVRESGNAGGQVKTKKAKILDAYYPRFFLLAALMPLYPIYMIVTNPLGYDSSSPLSPIEQYPSAFIYYLYKFLSMLPFLIFGLIIVLYTLRKRIRIQGNKIEARGIFRTKKFEMKDITMVKQYAPNRAPFMQKYILVQNVFFK